MKGALDAARATCTTGAGTGAAKQGMGSDRHAALGAVRSTRRPALDREVARPEPGGGSPDHRRLAGNGETPAKPQRIGLLARNVPHRDIARAELLAVFQAVA